MPHIGIQDPAIIEFFDDIKQNHKELFSLQYDVVNNAGLELSFQFHEPFKQPRIFQVPLAYQRSIHGLIDDLIDRKILAESNSPISCPIITMPDMNGDIRFMGDFRALNIVSVPKAWDFPDIEEVSKKVKGKVFTTIELFETHYQIPVAECDRDKTTISTFMGNYHFLRLPAGVIHTDGLVDRLVRKLTSDIPNIMNFCHNVIIYSED